MNLSLRLLRQRTEYPLDGRAASRFSFSGAAGHVSVHTGVWSSLHACFQTIFLPLLQRVFVFFCISQTGGFCCCGAHLGLGTELEQSLRKVQILFPVGPNLCLLKCSSEGGRVGGSCRRPFSGYFVLFPQDSPSGVWICNARPTTLPCVRVIQL